MARSSLQVEALFDEPRFPDIFVRDLGKIAVVGKPDLCVVPGAGLPDAQLDYDKSLVLLLASLGGTTEQVGRLLGHEEARVAATRDSVVKVFDVPNIAAAVNQAIIKDVLPVDLKRKDPKVKNPDKRELSVLEMIAKGFTNAEIGASLNKPKTKAQIRRINNDLFAKLATRENGPCNGRTHSVRRSYELKIMPLELETAEALS